MITETSSFKEGKEKMFIIILFRLFFHQLTINFAHELFKFTLRHIFVDISSSKIHITPLQYYLTKNLT